MDKALVVIAEAAGNRLGVTQGTVAGNILAQAGQRVRAQAQPREADELDLEQQTCVRRDEAVLQPLKHDAAVVCLTDKQPGESSLGSLVSLRGQAVRRRSRDGRRFTCEITTLKDKRRGPGWTWREVRHGPEGLS